MIKALIFDFDGLILDTETGEFKAWQQTYRDYGFDATVEEWADLIGRGATTTERTPYDDLREKLGGGFDVDVVRAKKRAYFAELIEKETVLPGVEAIIDAAISAGLRPAIASSSPRSWVHGFLTRLGLFDRFDAILTEDDVALAKPAPDLYLAALATLGVEACEALALEDSANGSTAAKAAGLYCVAVPNELTRLTSLDVADLIVPSLADVSLAELVGAADAYYARWM